MAKGDKIKLDRLAEEFDNLYLVSPPPEETADSDNLRVLRSGSAHPRIPAPPPLPSVPAQLSTNPNMTTSTTTSKGGDAYKFLPIAVSIREFTGQDSDYSAFQFLSQCEDVMRTSSITDDGDKISFVRSRLQAGSPALRAMEMSAFTNPQKKKDYKAFRTRFLSTFGDGSAGHFVQGLITTVERVLSVHSVHSWFMGQIHAANHTTNFANLLEDNGWIVGDNFPKDRFLNFMEICMFIFSLKPSERKLARSLTFSPTDTLGDFADKVKIKLEEKDGMTPAAVSVLAAAQPSPGSSADPLPSSAAVTASGKPTLTCTYCRRDGHTTSKCFARMRDQRKAQKLKGGATGGSSTPAPQGGPTGHSRPARADSSQPRSRSDHHAARNSASSGAFCIFHRSYTHSTDECHEILRLRDEREKQPQQPRGTSFNQSGEAARPGNNAPG